MLRSGSQDSKETENYRKIREYKIPECTLYKRPLDEPPGSQLLKDYENLDGEIQKIRIAEPKRPGRGLGTQTRKETTDPHSSKCPKLSESL